MEFPSRPTKDSCWWPPSWCSAAPTRPSDTTAAVGRIIDLLKRNGFYSTGIEPATATREPTQQVHIDFHADTGRRAKFDGLIANGDALRPLDKLIQSSGWKRFRGFLGWQQFTETRLQNGIDNIRSWYPKHDRLLAQVTLVNLDYHSGANTVTPVLAIDPGPPVLVRLRGAKLSSGKLRSLLPIYEERSVDRDLLEEGSRDLAIVLPVPGIFRRHSRLPDRQRPANGEQLIDYYVALGLRHKIVKVEIHGNHYFDDATIRERMSVIPATLVRYRHGRYSRNALERDLDAIRESLSRQWLPRRGSHLPAARRLQRRHCTHCDLHRHRRRLPMVRFQARLGGVSSADRPALMLLLHSTEGQPYGDLNIAVDRDNVLDYFFNNGYPAAKFDFTSVPSPQTHRVDLTFIVTPGERVYVRNVVVDGLQAHPPGCGDGPHQPACGRPAIAERDQRKPAPAVRSRHFFARRCGHPKPRRRRAHQVCALLARRSRTLFDERRRWRGNRTHRRRHHVARFAGRSHRLHPAFLVRDQPPEFLRIGAHHELADPGLHARAARPADLYCAAIPG